MSNLKPPSPSGPQSVSPRFMYRDECVWSVTWGPLLIANWFATGNARAAGELASRQAKHAERMREAPILVIIVDDEVPLPDERTRTVLVQGLGAVKDRLAALVLVSESAGFKGAAMRAAVSGMALLLRPACPVKVFASVREMAQWLPAAAPSFDSKVIESELARLRRERGGS